MPLHTPGNADNSLLVSPVINLQGSTLNPLQNIPQEVLRNCAQAIETVFKLPVKPVDESSVETVDFTNHYRVDISDFGINLNNSGNPLNLLATVVGEVADNPPLDVSGGSESILEPNVAEEGSSNNNNNLLTVNLDVTQNAVPNEPI